MKNYYYISESVKKELPNLEEVSKPFPSDSRGGIAYVAVIDEPTEQSLRLMFDRHEKKQTDFIGFFWGIIDSLVTLDIEDYDVDFDEPSQRRNMVFNDIIESGGIVRAIEEHLSISKEMNIAYAIYKMSEEFGKNPIDFVNEVVDTLEAKS